MKIARWTLAAMFAITACSAVSFAEKKEAAKEDTKKVDSSKFKEGGCCAKAAKKGEDCKHDCCAAAAKEGKVCEKCNPPAKDSK